MVKLWSNALFLKGTRFPDAGNLENSEIVGNIILFVIFLTSYLNKLQWRIILILTKYLPLRIANLKKINVADFFRAELQ